MRERMLAVINGGQLDRVPFVQYTNLDAPNEVVWDRIGREQMGILQWCTAYRFESPHCRFKEEAIIRDGLPGRRRTLITPAGNLTEERTLVPNMGGVTAIRKRFIAEPDDYPILMSYLRDITVNENRLTLQNIVKAIGDDGLPLVHFPRTPFQQLWVEWVPIEDLCLHLVDDPELVEECIDCLDSIQRRTWEVTYRVADSVDIPFVDFPDNITAPVIGKAYFRRYCLPYYNEAAEMMAEKGIPVYVHMDGDLKPLWDAIGESRVKGIDSLSPAPDNDTRVADAVTVWPEKRLLVNFPSSVHLADQETIYRQAAQILQEGGHTGRLWIQISENIPPGAWEKSYPAIVQAIQDFGVP
ncbi:MAG: hypothetical protein HY710_13045 [Candidatus Latescibacteria bacterium]|nr:hypothetical protein [Candidatus Latescibacterota bacterium]